MLIEIIISLLLVAILLWIFYIYLEWCDKYSSIRDIYNYNPNILSSKDRDMMDKYGKFILPEYLCDTFKPLRFWILYYNAKYINV